MSRKTNFDKSKTEAAPEHAKARAIRGIQPIAYRLCDIITSYTDGSCFVHSFPWLANCWYSGESDTWCFFRVFVCMRALLNIHTHAAAWITRATKRQFLDCGFSDWTRWVITNVRCIFGYNSTLYHKEYMQWITPPVCLERLVEPPINRINRRGAGLSCGGFCRTIPTSCFSWQGYAIDHCLPLPFVGQL